MQGPRHLGRDATWPIEDLDSFPAPAGCDRVVMARDGVAALCPVTGHPHFCTIVTDYLPRKPCNESNSLKLCLRHFRDRLMFCEQLAVDIRAEMAGTIKPRELRKSRGGIVVEATSSRGGASTEAAVGPNRLLNKAVFRQPPNRADQRLRPARPARKLKAWPPSGPRKRRQPHTPQRRPPS